MLNHAEDNCKYQKVRCPRACIEEILCQSVSNHLQRRCPLHMCDYHCPHCQYRGTFKSITTSTLFTVKIGSDNHTQNWCELVATVSIPCKHWASVPQ